jgi:hypothetical protein
LKEKNMKTLFLGLLMANSPAWAAEFTGRLTVYCPTLQSGKNVFSAQGVYVRGTMIELREFNPSVGEFETTAIVPTVGCVIGAEALVHGDPRMSGGQ